MYFKSYAAMDVDWVHLGSTPLANARVPSAVLRWKFENEGFETVELITGSVPSSLALRENGTTSDGMVTIPAGGLGVTLAGLGGQTHPAGAYLMSKYEVTNAEYTVFVDAGGYTTTRFWTHAFVRGGEVIPWEDAMAEFQDRTGRLGPATWEVQRVRLSVTRVRTPHGRRTRRRIETGFQMVNDARRSVDYLVERSDEDIAIDSQDT